MDATAIDILLRIGIGLAIGFLVGMTSIGGGTFVIAALTLGLGLPTSAAIGTASLFAFLTLSYATRRHLLLRTVDFRALRIFLCGAVPANILAAFGVTHRIRAAAADAAHLARLQDNLRLLIAVVILASACLLIARALPRAGTNGNGECQAEAEPPSVRGLWPRLAAGVVVGALVGSTSVIGVLIAPAMLVVYRLSPSRTVGTSTLIATVLALITALVYGRMGETELPTALWMAVGSLAGVFLGSHLTTRVPEAFLRFAVVTLIVAAGIAMLIR